MQFDFWISFFYILLFYLFLVTTCQDWKNQLALYKIVMIQNFLRNPILVKTLLPTYIPVLQYSPSQSDLELTLFSPCHNN